MNKKVLNRVLGVMCFILALGGLVMIFLNICLRSSTNTLLTIALGSICFASVLNLVRVSLDANNNRNDKKAQNY